MAKIKLTQIKSSSGSNVRQLETLKALGFKKLNSSVEKDATPQIMGMVRKVRHLIKIETL